VYVQISNQNSEYKFRRWKRKKIEREEKKEKNIHYNMYIYNRRYPRIFIGLSSNEI
jgi:hypothetical protein